MFNKISNYISDNIKVSVIVPVLNQEKLIERCITHLLHQSYSQQLIEIIIVDNNSTDKTREIVKKHPVKLFVEVKKGPAAARNMGICGATGDILVFLDSDCFAHKDLIKFHIQAHKSVIIKKREFYLIAGSIAGYNTNLWAICDDVCSWYTSHPKLPQRYVKSFLPAANMSIPVHVIRKIGGFDDTVMAGEDVLFCDKVKKSGYEILFEPGATVYHYNKNTFKEFLNHAKYWTQNELELRKRDIDHPRNNIKKIHIASVKQKNTGFKSIINKLVLLSMYLRHYFKAIFKIIKYCIWARRYYVFILLPFILLNKAIFGFYTLKADKKYRAELKSIITK